ncbi:hypothetical protein [Pseudophaeobacter leonis]|uniref:hypothetical protein n=1 Tax=Pseudophaeobacter leonis TaxID=1144477 RepID=UPI0009F3DC1D|nr:hypothetical protein [Pseudophaeobacter leonis]
MKTSDLTSAKTPYRNLRIAGWTQSGLFIALMIFYGAIKLGPLQILYDSMIGMLQAAPAAAMR